MNYQELDDKKLLELYYCSKKSFIESDYNSDTEQYHYEKYIALEKEILRRMEKH